MSAGQSLARLPSSRRRPPFAFLDRFTSHPARPDEFAEIARACVVEFGIIYEPFARAEAERLRAFRNDNVSQLSYDPVLLIADVY